MTKWLSPPDPSKNYLKALKKRHKDTGQWLLRDSRYSNWEKKAHSLLWLTGNSGCGKTVLSSTVIEKLESNPNTKIILYFYFDFSNGQKQTLENAIRALTSQLYHISPTNVGNPLEKVFASHMNGQQQASLESLLTAFQHMSQQAGELWIVLDALDECPNKQQQRQELLGWIHDFHTGSSNVHILVTSRPEPDIKFAIEEKWLCAIDVVTLESDLVQQDISSYVHWEVKEGSRLVRWHGRDDIQKNIKDVLVEKAHGMYDDFTRHY